MTRRIFELVTVSFVVLLPALGCSRSGNDEIVRARVEVEEARAEAEAARTEAKAARADAEATRAEAKAARAEVKDPRRAATPHAEQNSELSAANWVRQLGGGLEVALIEGGYQFPVKPSDKLPDKPFRLHLIAFVGNPLQIDKGLANLEGLYLQGLWLHDSRITDRGLAHVGRIKGLENLTLQNTEITDAGLEHLKGLTKLKLLELDGTKVSDNGLALLEGLSTLERISLTRTRVTAGGVEKLKKALPSTKIER